MSTPHRFDIVQRIARERADLLETNTYASCGDFVRYVLTELEQIDPGEWGMVGKTHSEGQWRPPAAYGFPRVVDGHTITGVSEDVIWHRPSNQQIDIIANAAANSDPRPEIHRSAHATWQMIPREHYRPHNPWLPPLPLEKPSTWTDAERRSLPALETWCEIALRWDGVAQNVLGRSLNAAEIAHVLYASVVESKPEEAIHQDLASWRTVSTR